MPGNYSKIETVVTGQSITAAERNTEHDNHITYQTPAGTDDYSATVTEMRTASDPYPAGTPSQPTSLAGELERLRYLGVQITGKTYWYEDPGTSIEALLTHTHTGSPAGGQVAHSGLSGLTVGDDHTQYRLEAADHSHISTGLQGGQLDHGAALTGLTDDDHTQYVLLAGRAAGQAIFGGTAASETLTLKSTSHGTKGKVIFGAAGTTAYDEVNERVGIGIATPGAKLHIYNGASGGTAVAGSRLIIEGSGTNDSIQFLTPNTEVARINFGDPENNIVGGLYYGHASDTLNFVAANSVAVTIGSTSVELQKNLLFSTDNTYDIGATGATRPRNLYLAGTLKEGTVALARHNDIAGDSQTSLTTWTTADADLMTIGSVTLATGTWIRMHWRWNVNSAAGTNNLSFRLRQSAGTAVVKFFRTGGGIDATTRTPIFALPIVTSAAIYIQSGVTLLYVATGGTATFVWSGLAGASNATSAQLDCQTDFWVG